MYIPADKNIRAKDMVARIENKILGYDKSKRKTKDRTNSPSMPMIPDAFFNLLILKSKLFLFSSFIYTTLK